MQPATLEPLFFGSTARQPGGPVRVDGLIPFRRLLGEGVDDGSGPPGALLRSLWGFFRSGGQRARVVSRGPDPWPHPLDAPALSRLARQLTDAAGAEWPPLICFPGLPREPEDALALASLPVVWPDPSPLVLLDAPPRLARDAVGLPELAARLLEQGQGRFRLVTPPALGAAPVQGPSRPGPISAAALAAGLIAAGGGARLAGSGFTLPRPFHEAQLRQLHEQGVIVLWASQGHLTGLGLPRWPGAFLPPPDETHVPLADSPLGPLVEHLTDALAHHAHTEWDPGLYQRVERDARSALGRFFGRSARGFTVRCNEELNPPASRDQGLVIVELILGPPLPVVREVVLTLRVG